MNEELTYIGIDNGISGALAFYKPAKQMLVTMPMPIIKAKSGKGFKSEYDIPQILSIIRNFSFIRMAILEKAQSFPGQGVSSMFTIGKNFGIMLGILTALQLPHQIIHPRRWQKRMFEDIPHKDTKAASILVASRLFPSHDFRATEKSKVLHHGCSDAALMAYYSYLSHEKDQIK